MADGKSGPAGNLISTAMRILAEVVASNAAWLVAFNRATDEVMEKNPKARSNPKAIA